MYDTLRFVSYCTYSTTGPKLKGNEVLLYVKLQFVYARHPRANTATHTSVASEFITNEPFGASRVKYRRDIAFAASGMREEGKERSSIFFFPSVMLS